MRIKRDISQLTYVRMCYQKLSLLFILILVISCDVSTISDKELKNISNIKANIYIQDYNEGDCLNKIIVYVTDGKKQIISNLIKIKVNEIPLELIVRQELYYTKKSYYTVHNFIRSECYYFEITLPDSTIYPLAFIKPSNINDSLEFNIPQVISREKDFTLNWENINLPAELKIWKGVQKKDTKEHSGGEYAETTISKSINSKTGEFIIPKSYFEDSVSIANYLKVTCNHREFGLINPRLLINSDIVYDFKLKGTIDMIE